MGNFIFSTIPEPPTSQIAFTLTIEDDTLDLLVDGNTYELYLDNEPANVYTATGQSGTPNFVTFTNVVSITSGTVRFTVTDTETGNIYSDNLSINPICYGEGSLIQCLVNGVEKEIPIEDIKEGMIINTYLHGGKKVIGMIKTNFNSTGNTGLASLYKLPKDSLGNNMPFEDLYVTGGHSILVDNMDKQVFNLMENMMGKNTVMVDDKYRYLSYKHPSFEISDIKNINIYHPILENENDFGQYGIYANGILSESTCIQLYKLLCKK